jgi:hypothetical protein
VDVRSHSCRERKLSALEDGKSAALQTEITQDAISKADRSGSCSRSMRVGRATLCWASRGQVFSLLLRFFF